MARDKFSRIRMFTIALVVGFVAAACQTDGGGPPGTSAAGWHQIAVGAGQVIGSTKADPKVEKAMAQVKEYCPYLRAASVGVTIFSPAKAQEAAAIAAGVVKTVCDAPPPRTVAEALVLSAEVYRTYLAVRQSRQSV